MAVTAASTLPWAVSKITAIGCGLGGDLLQQLHAVHARHLQIGNHDGGVPGLHFLQCLPRRRRRCRFRSPRREPIPPVRSVRFLRPLRSEFFPASWEKLASFSRSLANRAKRVVHRAFCLDASGGVTEPFAKPESNACRTRKRSSKGTTAGRVDANASVILVWVDGVQQGNRAINQVTRKLQQQSESQRTIVVDRLCDQLYGDSKGERPPYCSRGPGLQ